MDEKKYIYLIKAHYDESGYRALGEATWKLFWQKKMQTRSYPIFGAIAVILLFLLMQRFSTLGAMGKIGYIFGIAFFISLFWLSNVTGRRKIARRTLALARERGTVPLDVTFHFEKNRILAVFGEEEASVRYDKTTYYVTIGEWEILFFGSGAYLWKTSDLEEAASFHEFLEAQTGLKRHSL